MICRSRCWWTRSSRLCAPSGSQGGAGSSSAGQLRELAAVLPAVGALAEVEAAPASGERHRVARAVRALLERLAAERPVALLLDDVQWADPASADVLALLLHRPPRGGVLLALAARAGRAPRLEAALAAAVQRRDAECCSSSARCRSRRRRRCCRGPARRRASVCTGRAAATRSTLQELARAADFGAAAGAAPGLAGVPRAVQAALAGEVAALPAEARRVLEGAAVVGDPFEVELAAVAAAVEEEAALAALDELLAAELVRPTSQPRRFRLSPSAGAPRGVRGGGRRLAAGARTPGRPRRWRRAARRRRSARTMSSAPPGRAIWPRSSCWRRRPRRPLLSRRRRRPGGGRRRCGCCPTAAEHDRRRLELLGAQGRALVSAGRPVEARDALRRVLAMLPADAAGERVRVVEALADLEALWLDNREEARRLLQAERDGARRRRPTAGRGADLRDGP